MQHKTVSSPPSVSACVCRSNTSHILAACVDGNLTLLSSFVCLLAPVTLSPCNPTGPCSLQGIWHQQVCVLQEPVERQPGTQRPGVAGPSGDACLPRQGSSSLLFG
eukprot:2114606-Rhodomonas_salina.1